MNPGFRLLMIGAMYENGGNTTHRFLDGHPGLYVYPFESQLGTRLVNDQLSSLFPAKYRWPVFALDATPEEDYAAIIDEETKVRARTPHVSKFRHDPFQFSDDERREHYVRLVSETGRSRANNVAAFFRSTFEAWNDHAASGAESVYVGYSPAITVDAEKLLEELPSAHFIHVVRNPWSAYADTKKRPVPLSLSRYMLCWTVNQYYAVVVQERFPDRFHILRIEDVIQDPIEVLGSVLARIGLQPDSALKAPSWNGRRLEEVYPWGTIRTATSEANRRTAAELSDPERDEIRLRAWKYLELFGYENFPEETSVRR